MKEKSISKKSCNKGLWFDTMVYSHMISDHKRESDCNDIQIVEVC